MGAISIIKMPRRNVEKILNIPPEYLSGHYCLTVQVLFQTLTVTIVCMVAQIDGITVEDRWLYQKLVNCSIFQALPIDRAGVLMTAFACFILRNTQPGESYVMCFIVFLIYFRTQRLKGTTFSALIVPIVPIISIEVLW